MNIRIHIEALHFSNYHVTFYLVKSIVWPNMKTKLKFIFLNSTIFTVLSLCPLIKLLKRKFNIEAGKVDGGELEF